MLDITDGLHNMGGLQGNIVLTLMVAWIIVYLVLIKGVETFGKVRDYNKYWTLLRNLYRVSWICWCYMLLDARDQKG